MNLNGAKNVDEPIAHGPHGPIGAAHPLEWIIRARISQPTKSHTPTPKKNPPKDTFRFASPKKIVLAMPLGPSDHNTR